MADFISLHPEEWVALISGLRFSAAVVQAKFIFIPVIILAIGWSLLIWLYRLERDREWNAFILWLIFSSAILISTFRTQKVVVELNPIVLNTKSMMLSVKQEEVRVDKKRGTIYYNPDASGISALLSIPDKIASLMFNFMDANLLRKLTGQARTIPLDNMACRDPRYVAGLVQMLNLDWALGLSMKNPDDVREFRARVQAFAGCYRKGFEGVDWTVIPDLKFFHAGKEFAEAAGRGLITTIAASPLRYVLKGIKVFPQGRTANIAWTTGTFLVGAVGGEVYNLVGRYADGKLYIKCETFVVAFKRTTEQIVEKCDEFLGVKRDDEEKKAFVNAVLACLKNPDYIPAFTEKEEDVARARGQCLALRDKTLAALETAMQAVNERTNLTSDPVKNFFSRVVSDLKAWWFSTTYLDFPLKFDLLAKGQGIVLAILTGMFPFIAVLSVIPVGRHFMNWPLLLNYMIAYFLVKMWIPLLFFIVNVATHNLARITGG